MFIQWKAERLGMPEEAALKRQKVELESHQRAKELEVRIGA